jgi:hypothetical protein
MVSGNLKKGRLQFILVAAAFIGPLVLATLMYLGGFGATQSGAGSNHGILLQPIVHLPDVVTAPDIANLAGGGWLLVYINTAACEVSCKEALYKLRQSRLMLGSKMERVVRLFLHGESAPDKVFLSEQHDGLINFRDGGLSELMDSKRPAAVLAGGFFLIDPLGNLVMYFPPQLNPRQMVDDIELLLELSRIG